MVQLDFDIADKIDSTNLKTSYVMVQHRLGDVRIVSIAFKNILCYGSAKASV